MVLIQERPRTKPMPPESPRMVDPEEYCRLAISLRSLERCDDADLGLRILRDTMSGERYAVEDSRLMKYKLSQI